MGERSSFKVPRRRVAVELGLSGQAARRVEIFLGEHRHHAWHRQDVLDLLEGERQFLPCTEPGGEVTLVNRDHIVWLAMSASEDRKPSDEETPDLDLLYDHCHHVSLRLGVGTAIDGVLLHSAPSEHARLADHVNQPGGFLSVHAGDLLILVRKSAVIEIIESEPGDERPEEIAG